MPKLRFLVVLIVTFYAFTTAGYGTPHGSIDNGGSLDDDPDDTGSTYPSAGEDYASEYGQETSTLYEDMNGETASSETDTDSTPLTSAIWNLSSTTTDYPSSDMLGSDGFEPTTNELSPILGSPSGEWISQESTTTENLVQTYSDASSMPITTSEAAATSSSHKFSTTYSQGTASSTAQLISSSSSTSDSQNDRSSLNHRDKTIVIAVCTVAGTIALGILLLLLFCWLRHRHRDQADASTSAMPLARNGEGEMESIGDLGFSHWNGRKVERYTPLTTNHNPPLVDGSSLGPRISGNYYPHAFPANPNLANPFVPQPPPTRKPVGSPPSNKRNIRAASTGEIAVAVASRHDEEDSSQRPSTRQDHIGSSENHSLATYQMGRESLITPTTHFGDNNGPRISDGTPTATTSASVSQRSKPLPPVGLARFIGSSRKKEPYSALSPPTTSHSHRDDHGSSFNNNSESITNQNNNLLPASSKSNSSMLVSMPSEEQRRSLSERQMAHEHKRASTPRQSLLMHQPRIANTSSKHLSLVEASSQASRRSKVRGSREVITSSSTLDGGYSSISSKGPGMSNGAVRPTSDVQSPVLRQERMSFSYPRAEAHAGPELHMDTREGQNRSNEEGIDTALTTIIPAPSIPWQEAPRSSSESWRSFGPDGKPRRLRLSDFEDRGGGSNRRPGIGRAL